MKKGIRLTLAAAAALLASQAMAFEFNGYLRAGPVFSGAEPTGTTGADQPQAYKYSLGGAGQNYRLGNEGDFYGEFLLSHKQQVGNQSFTFGWMPSVYNSKPNPSSTSYDTAQLFLEMAGFDFAPNAKFWAGKRYQRSDVHIVDTFYINYGSNVGAGVYDLDVAGAKLGVHAYSSDEFIGKKGVKDTANRITADLYDINTNPGGKFRVVASLVNGDYINGSSGTAVSLKHDQADFGFKGLTNSVWLQAAQGHAGLNTGFADTKHSGVRALDSINWQSGPWGGQAQVVYERDKTNADLTDAETKVTRTSLGGRVSYAFTQNFKLLGEVGVTSAKVDGKSGSAKLNKFTIAPTLALNGDFWSRPELRFYVTHVTWNDKASSADIGGVIGATPATLTDTTKKSTTLVGVQAEIWF
jgi:maltoporin